MNLNFTISLIEAASKIEHTVSEGALSSPVVLYCHELTSMTLFCHGV